MQVHWDVLTMYETYVAHRTHLLVSEGVSWACKTSSWNQTVRLSKDQTWEWLRKGGTALVKIDGVHAWMVQCIC